MNPASPKAVKKILGELGTRPNKALGQNFLIDEKVLSLTVEASQITGQHGVLEIGPGIGALTYELSKHAGKVAAIEIDRIFAAYLEGAFSDCGNVKIICADALKSDLNKIISENFGNMPVAVVANLPYYITSPLIMKFLEDTLPVESVTVMIQKEVAQRITASPSTADYGALSVAAQYYSTPRIIGFVPPESFLPPPKVTSAVIRLDLKNHVRPQVKNEKKFFLVVKAAFGQRRKTLANALSACFDMPKDEIKEIIKSICQNENVRGENLDIDQFIKISELIR